MKFAALGDLHIGKRVHGFSMLEDQQHILRQITDAVRAERPDGVMIAGDVYDRSVPSTEAVELFDSFLFELWQEKVPVFVVAGNHDSAERLSFASRLIEKSGVHISPAYGGEIKPVTLHDEFGPVNIFMLPFIKPAQLRRHFPELEIESYSDAVSAAIGAMDIPQSERNILITHQMVTGGARSDSEEISVGALDSIEASVFAPFDYVALGHLHRPQNIAPNIRYCGSPLKYSFSEAGNKNSITVVELREKGSLTLRALPLTPLRDMKELRGSYRELMKNRGEAVQDYVRVTLTDEQYIPYVFEKLRAVYPNLMKLDYDNSRTRAGALPESWAEVKAKSPVELFAEFFKAQNNRPMSGGQLDFVKKLIKKLIEEEAQAQK